MNARTRLLKLTRRAPELTRADLARHLKVSRQRIAQLVTAEGLRVPTGKPGRPRKTPCDNKLCVRPDHLFLGTQSDNIADRDRKGRHKNQFSDA